jgi:pimeloyl-ACP methyl ester carboxylesterase
MHPLMRRLGHELLTPTYTGLGERVHLASPEVGLDTHIEDIVNVLVFEDLREVTLVGHSYGGMVATGVGDRARERIAEIVYLDAFVPRNGQSLFDLVGADAVEAMRRRARDFDGWRVPPNPLPTDTPEPDVAWAAERRVPQPIKAFETRLTLSAEPSLPRSYIYCSRVPPGDPFAQFAARARSESGWRCFELDASHNPHLTMPDTLANLLDRVVAKA